MYLYSMYLTVSVIDEMTTSVMIGSDKRVQLEPMDDNGRSGVTKSGAERVK